MVQMWLLEVPNALVFRWGMAVHMLVILQPKQSISEVFRVVSLALRKTSREIVPCGWHCRLVSNILNEIVRPPTSVPRKSFWLWWLGCMRFIMGLKVFVNSRDAYTITPLHSIAAWLNLALMWATLPFLILCRSIVWLEAFKRKRSVEEWIWISLMISAWAYRSVSSQPILTLRS